MRHRRALVTIVAAMTLDLVLGLLYAASEHMGVGHALFCAVGNAVTEGACTTPATTAGRWIDTAEFVLVVPLFAATFSLVTSGLTATHVKAEGERARRRLDHIIRHHPEIPDLPSRDQDG